MAAKGTAELYEEFEELRSTTWFQALLAAAWVLLLSSAFSLYTLGFANRFLKPPLLLVFPNLLLLCLALLLLRIRFHFGEINRKDHAPLLVLRALYQYRPFLLVLLALGVCLALLLPLNFLSEGGQVQSYTCQVRSSPFDPQSQAKPVYDLYLSCSDLQSPPPVLRVTAPVWARFKDGGQLVLETRKGWLGERWVGFRF